MGLLAATGKIMDRLCVVAGAFVGSQIPEFMQQYKQHLAGHVDELQRLLSQLQEIAAHSNKTLEEYFHKFLTSSDPDFVRQGEFMQEMHIRWNELNQALVHLSQSSILTRPFVFLKEIQYDIANSTFSTFQPGINLSLEGLLYAAAGMLLGWGIYQTASKGLNIGCANAKANFKQNF